MSWLFYHILLCFCLFFLIQFHIWDIIFFLFNVPGIVYAVHPYGAVCPISQNSVKNIRWSTCDCVSSPFCNCGVVSISISFHLGYLFHILLHGMPVFQVLSPGMHVPCPFTWDSRSMSFHLVFCFFSTIYLFNGYMWSFNVVPLIILMMTSFLNKPTLCTKVFCTRHLFHEWQRNENN